MLLVASRLLGASAAAASRAHGAARGAHGTEEAKLQQQQYSSESKPNAHCGAQEAAQPTPAAIGNKASNAPKVAALLKKDKHFCVIKLKHSILVLEKDAPGCKMSWPGQRRARGYQSHPQTY